MLSKKTHVIDIYILYTHTYIQLHHPKRSYPWLQRAKQLLVGLKQGVRQLPVVRSEAT